MSTGTGGGGGAGGQPSEEELRAAYEAEIKKIRVEHVVLENIVTLINLGMRRTGLAPGTEGERDVAQVQLAIESVRALLPLIEPSVPQQVGPIRDAVSQLQLAFVRIGGQAGGAGAGAGGAGEGEAGGAGGGAGSGGAGGGGGAGSGGGAGGASGAGGGGAGGGGAGGAGGGDAGGGGAGGGGAAGPAPGARPGDPGPAQRSGRLWIPGQ